MSGGGGTQTTEVKNEISGDLKKRGKQAAERSELLAQIPFMPNMGVQYAAFSPMQTAAFGNTQSAANAFGLGGGQGNYLPAPENVGGFLGYSTATPYQDMLNRSVPMSMQEYIAGLFLDPNNPGNPPQRGNEQETKKSSGSGGKGGASTVNRSLHKNVPEGLK